LADPTITHHNSWLRRQRKLEVSATSASARLARLLWVDAARPARSTAFLALRQKWIGK
jgi:hypothetical protein